MFINQCPLCSKQNCFETINYMIDGMKYTGIKCIECNSIIYSERVDDREEIDRQKKRFDELAKVNNN